MRCWSPTAARLPLDAAGLLLPSPNAESRPGALTASCREAWPALWRSCKPGQVPTVGQQTWRSMYIAFAGGFVLQQNGAIKHQQRPASSWRCG